ncbi:hypothetical protein [Sulfurovum sp. NBC37-1]|uniref:hypothetical protein n=1 Tax=Sulfurovum sp. (strain NBC37-1) TaxID=387093 RepID=UPI0001587746|nr:hypothetical protein [Sulfurovum sp. NBC37-1]BAF71008.1 hypothetical protein SUN_0048 [Sulfurovum sp. NBC37-1]
MQLSFELVTYDDELDSFELDENIYQIELDDEAAKTYEVVKSSDLLLYSWLKKSDFFLKHIKEEVYQDSENKKIAISDINGVSYRRFYFFKVTSGDSHYEYFKKLFNIHEESEWQDREDVGEEILEHLSTRRKELILELG